MAKESNSVATPPQTKKRAELLSAMPSALQDIAKEMDKRLAKGASGVVLIKYDLGAMIHQVVEDEGSYGSKAVEKLAAYLGERATTLYNLRDFAASFDREYVEEWTKKPMADGGYMTESHWMSLRQVAKVSDRERLLKQTLSKSYSANELETEIRSGAVKTKNVRSGGRRPSKPTSPLAGLHKFNGLAISLFNYGETVEETVFEQIDDISSDNVSPALLEKLKTTKDTTEKLRERLDENIEHLELNIERVETILDKKEAEEAEKAAQEADAESDGEAAPKKKKKKIQKPVAAGASDD
jgi:hypothetical protein